MTTRLRTAPPRKLIARRGFHASHIASCCKCRSPSSILRTVGVGKTSGRAMVNARSDIPSTARAIALNPTRMTASGLPISLLRRIMISGSVSGILQKANIAICSLQIWVRSTGASISPSNAGGRGRGWRSPTCKVARAAKPRRPCNDDTHGPPSDQFSDASPGFRFSPGLKIGLHQPRPQPVRQGTFFGELFP
jgi:hypothetical protein